jgi:hypothetical protein
VQFTYQRNIEALLRNYFFHVKTIIITYSECVSVALVISDPSDIYQTQRLSTVNMPNNRQYINFIPEPAA